MEWYEMGHLDLENRAEASRSEAIDAGSDPALIYVGDAIRALDYTIGGMRDSLDHLREDIEAQKYPDPGGQ